MSFNQREGTAEGPISKIRHRCARPLFPKILSGHMLVFISVLTEIYIFLHFSTDGLYGWDILLGYSFGISSNGASTASYGTAFPKRPQTPCGPTLPPYPGLWLIPPNSRGVAAHRHEANIG